MSESSLEVTQCCDRTEKPFAVQVPVSKYRDFLIYQRYKERTMDKLKAYLLEAKALPDLVVVYKGRVVLLPTVHPKQDSLIGRLLNSVVNDDIFPVVKRPRNKKDVK